MNKSDNTKSVTIHRRVKSTNTVDRSQAKRPAAANNMSKKDSKSSSNNNVAVKIKKSPAPAPAKTTTRSKMISHFDNTMPSETSIGVRVVKKETTVSKDSSMAKAPATKTSIKVSTGKSMNSTSPKMSSKIPSTVSSSSAETVVMHPMLKTARARMQERRMMMTAPATQSQSTLSARELKDIAIRKALASTERTTEKETVKPHKLHFSFGRILIALGCTAAAVFAIAYFINLNISDFSLYAAAKQAGIESANKEPHVPQEYSITNISSENGKIEINYKHSQTGETMTISEEKSSWDSDALLTNFVRDNYNSSFITIREQGLTIYISESNACWVNGGIVYKITAPSGSLSKKQIRQIATSL